MLQMVVRLNKKTAAAKAGPHLKSAEAELQRLNSVATPMEQAVLLTTGFTFEGIGFAREDILVEYTAPSGWAGTADKGTQVMIDARITPELKAEGTARDVVRFVQDSRKDAGLDVADKIELFLGTEADALKAAIAAHRPTIANETQAVRWSETPLNGDAHTATVKVDGQPLTIALRKVG
jgi:isoleucyl-tRNA synthetase